MHVKSCGLGGKGNAGVAAAVQKTRGAIGYVELAYAVSNKIGYTRMVNAAGKTVSASIASTMAAVKTAWFDERLASTIVKGRRGIGGWNGTATRSLRTRSRADEAAGAQTRIGS